MANGKQNPPPRVKRMQDAWSNFQDTSTTVLSKSNKLYPYGYKTETPKSKKQGSKSKPSGKNYGGSDKDYGLKKIDPLNPPKYHPYGPYSIEKPAYPYKPGKSSDMFWGKSDNTKKTYIKPAPTKKSRK